MHMRTTHLLSRSRQHPVVPKPKLFIDYDVIAEPWWDSTRQAHG